MAGGVRIPDCLEKFASLTVWMVIAQVLVDMGQLATMEHQALVLAQRVSTSP